jgi:hypothetical protein
MAAHDDLTYGIKLLTSWSDWRAIMLSKTSDMPLWADPQNMWRRLEQITFAAFMGSLVTLLVLLYADVPIVGY